MTYLNAVRTYSPGMDEADTSLYTCPECDAEKEVAEEFDLASRMFFPVRFVDTMCPNCEEVAMDRKVLR